MGKLIPRAKAKAYILSDKVAFVPHPEFRAMWLRVDPCVVLAACRQCGSKKGVPCRHSANYGVFTHAWRRDDASKETLVPTDHTVVKYNEPPSIKE